MRPACADADPEAFFPEKGGDVLPALRICLGICAAINGENYLDACITQAKAEASAGDYTPESAGVRGGLSARQLRDERYGYTTVDKARAFNRARLGLVSA